VTLCEFSRVVHSQVLETKTIKTYVVREDDGALTSGRKGSARRTGRKGLRMSFTPIAQPAEGHKFKKAQVVSLPSFSNHKTVLQCNAGLGTIKTVFALPCNWANQVGILDGAGQPCSFAEADQQTVS